MSLINFHKDISMVSCDKCLGEFTIEHNSNYPISFCPLCGVVAKDDRLTVHDAELTARTNNALENAGFKYLDDALKLTDRELLRVKNFGRKSLNEIRRYVHT